MKNTTRDHTKRAPKAMLCTCKSEYQDNRYGANQRLHNPNKDDKWRCSVCGHVKG